MDFIACSLRLMRFHQFLIITAHSGHTTVMGLCSIVSRIRTTDLYISARFALFSYHSLRSQVYRPLTRGHRTTRPAASMVPTGLWRRQHPALFAAPRWRIAVPGHLERLQFLVPLSQPVVRILSTG